MTIRNEDFSGEFIETNNFKALRRILASREFAPTYVYGPTGCGKTRAVLEAARSLYKPVVRVNLVEETSERDLIGGWVLREGETRWVDGPVIQAMKNGSILLLDEVDLAGPKIMCLQSILEGNSYLSKQVGTVISPKNGFKIVATANTRGAADDEGRMRYNSTKIQNEAFLDRFDFTLRFDYMSVEEELRVLSTHTNASNKDEILRDLVNWAHATRNSKSESIISTRRLISVLKYLKILGYDGNKKIQEKDLRDSIAIVVSRFGEEAEKALSVFFDQIRKEK